MDIETVKGATRTLGVKQGFQGLPLRDQYTFDTGTKQTYHAMVTQWRPSLDDIRRIVAGEPIMLQVLGTRVDPPFPLMQCAAISRHPPVLVYVGDIDATGDDTQQVLPLT